MYEMVAYGFMVVVGVSLFLLFVVINLQLARNYVTEQFKRIYPDLFDLEIRDAGDYVIFCMMFIVFCLVAVALSIIWPIYVVAVLGGIVYVILRCARYLVRKRKQFAEVLYGGGQGL